MQASSTTGVGAGTEEDEFELYRTLPALLDDPGELKLCLVVAWLSRCADRKAQAADPAALRCRRAAPRPQWPTPSARPSVLPLGRPARLITLLVTPSRPTTPVLETWHPRRFSEATHFQCNTRPARQGVRPVAPQSCPSRYHPLTTK